MSPAIHQDAKPIENNVRLLYHGVGEFRNLQFRRQPRDLSLDHNSFAKGQTYHVHAPFVPTPEILPVRYRKIPHSLQTRRQYMGKMHGEASGG